MSVLAIKTARDLAAAFASSAGKLVVVDFFAPWCQPCKVIAPFVAKLAVDYPDVVFLKASEREAPDLMAQQGVTAFPTFQLFVNSRQVDELRGASPEELLSKIRANKPRPPPTPLTPLEVVKNEAKRLFGLGKYRAAAEAYTQALDLDPTSSLLYSNRALCGTKFGSAAGWERALADSTRALELDSANVKAQYYQGKALCGLGREGEGIAALKLALAQARALAFPHDFIAEVQAAIAEAEAL